LGDIYLNSNNANEDNTILIPYKIVSRNSQMVSGLMFGAIGGGIHALVNEAKGVIGVHRMVIQQNNNYTPELNMPVNNCDINVEAP